MVTNEWQVMYMRLQSNCDSFSDRGDCAGPLIYLHNDSEIVLQGYMVGGIIRGLPRMAKVNEIPKWFALQFLPRELFGNPGARCWKAALQLLYAQQTHCAYAQILAGAS